MKTNQLGPVVAPVCFRHFMQAELARRCAQNKQYSLRAFAKFLQVDHSTLSQLLRGSRKLTARTIRRFGVRLGLDEDSVTEFIGAAERSPDVDSAALGDIRKLASETAILIAEWQHYAILELVRLQTFRNDSRWVARVLGLSVDEVNIALQRLTRLGLLSMDAPDHWTDRSGDVTASVGSFTRAALQQLVEHSREHLVGALTTNSNKRCVFSSTTLALSRVHVAEAAQRIELLRRELLTLVQSGGRLDDVYRLDISLVPLTTLQSLEDSDGTTCDAMADRDTST
jgi:transcriptional regulator with XRE-family HTH domain